MAKETNRKLNWKANFETLEDRFLMSADPLGGLLGGSIVHHQDLDGAIEHHQESLPDFWIEDTDEQQLQHQLEQIETALANAHNQTGQTEVIADYGFDGGGQTVAIIDSGIAYDHYALGGGLGEGYRVVGGWDFTGENDADPYDDGPSGSHGTHVAGIVGSDSGTHKGVATGVDLVGLRVFDDAGNGWFSWVEDALQWVHDNRNSFDNPITTVNLSLGTNYNADTVPNWAMLEDEFAQLEADGIFIAVSAGNSFTSYNTPGLSYPAASSHVVPVMSLDDNGSLSYFSQRHSRAIAAPGRTIVSTVPDYAGNNNGVTDDWASFSGTSMASPYLAGASVLIREAMEFVGYANITQDTIYDHIVDTSDQVWDASTSAWYNSLNLEAAIDALMPTDDFGSSIVSAFDLGTITSAADVNGVISTLDDADYFSFTSGVTGTVTFTAASMTHDLEAAWQLNGGGGEVSGAANEAFTFDVVAGQDYTLNFSSANGLGYYDFDITSEASFSFVDLGAVTFSEIADTASTVEQWYRIETTNAGYVSVESFFDTANGQIGLHLFDANMQEIDAGNGVNGAARVDAYAAASEELFICVLGTNADIDLRLSNLVSLDGTTVQVQGTDGNDEFAFTAGSTTHNVSVNGVSYDFAVTSISNVNFDGGNGNDTITMTGTAGDEIATLKAGDIQLSGAGFVATAGAVENVNVNGGGGLDVAHLHDTAGNDVYVAWYNQASLTGSGYSHTVRDFDNTNAYAISGGYDQAVFYDTVGDDTYVAWYNQATMSGSGYSNSAQGFDLTHAYGVSGGYDQAVFYDTAGNDLYVAWYNQASMSGNGYSNAVFGFDTTHAHAVSGGHDVAAFYDTAGDDSYVAWYNQARLSGSGYSNSVSGFDSTNAHSVSGGNDQAAFYDTAGDDFYVAWYNQATMSGNGYINSVRGFDSTNAYAASGGYDQAAFYDTSGDDLYGAWYNQAYMSGSGYSNAVSGFDRTNAYAASGGHDQALFYDTAGDDLFVSWYNLAYMTGSGYSNEARGFDRTNAYAASGGYDQALFYDTANDDVYAAWSDRAVMYGDGYFNDARGFERSTAHGSSGGNDSAELYDSSGDELLVARAWGAYLSGQDFYNEVRGFGNITAQLTGGGDDTVDVEVVDYAFELVNQSS